MEVNSYWSYKCQNQFRLCDHVNKSHLLQIICSKASEYHHHHVFLNSVQHLKSHNQEHHLNLSKKIETDVCNRTAPGQKPSGQDFPSCSAVNSYMPLGKSPSLSELQFPDLQNEGVGMDQVTNQRPLSCFKPANMFLFGQVLKMVSNQLSTFGN